LVFRLHHWLDSFEIDIGKLFLPEIIKTVDHITEFVVGKVLVGACNKCVQLIKDPFVGKAEVGCVFLDAILAWHEVFWEVAHTELDNIPEFVAEFSVADDSLDI
jgi:hypothetical protein